MGRFLSVDPLVGNPLSAQDYNGYSYCANNPLAFTDPSGYQKYATPEMYCIPGNEFYLDRIFGGGGGGGIGGGGDDPSGYYPSALDDAPRSMFDWWTPYQNSKKQGNTATPMQYLNDVNRGKNYWTEEYSRDQDMADYKKDLAVFPNSLRGEMRIVIKHYYQAQYLDEQDNNIARSIVVAVGASADGINTPISIARVALGESGAALKMFTRTGTVIGAIAGGVPAAIHMWNNGLNWSDGLAVGLSVAGITAEFFGVGEIWDSVAIPVTVGITVGTVSSDVYNVIQNNKGGY